MKQELNVFMEYEYFDDSQNSLKIELELTYLFVNLDSRWFQVT